jgi:hypothetical protein
MYMIQQEIVVKVSFTKHTLTKKDIRAVEGDYNTTKFVFEFEEDVSNHPIVFLMSNPQEEIVLETELDDNREVVLVGYDSEGNPATLFSNPGSYPFELILYADGGKLTSAPGWLTVDKRLIPVDGGNQAEAYVPVFDELLSQIGDALGDVNDANMILSTVVEGEGV